jgi:hypothetical protein
MTPPGALGAGRALDRATDRFRNRLQPFGLGRGNGSSCPQRRHSLLRRRSAI